MAASTYKEAVNQAIISSNQLHDVVNGTALTEVTVEDGSQIPSVRKALTDNFFFKSPVDWVAGDTEEVFNQLRYFKNSVLSGYYYAPSATKSNPIQMGNSPVTDTNWVLYGFAQQQIPSEVFPWVLENATGTETTITPPYVFDSAIVTINGVVQVPGAAYTISNSTIKLSEPLGNNPDTGAANLLFAYIGKLEQGVNDYLQPAVLASSTGSSLIGEVDSVAALRQTIATKVGQKVEVKGYNSGTSKGGGKFYYITDSVTPDDGGTFFRVSSSGGWKRQHTSKLDITHFGAVMDGVTDDMPAVLKMHAYSMAQNVTTGPGIYIPAGKTALSVADLGADEISSFKLRGPHVAFGRCPEATILPFSATETRPMFTFCARYMEVSGIFFSGEDTSGKDRGTVQPFIKNTVTRGAYCRISGYRSRFAGGRQFQVIDTIDTKLDQFYSSSGKAAAFISTWSNLSPGSWDHSTAIEVSNANIEGHTGEYAFQAIRATQSRMDNVWFDKNENAFDISQGDWKLTTVTQENSVNPSATQYAKLIDMQYRYANGQGMSDTTSGYKNTMDTVDGVYKGIPSWVTSAYEQGKVKVANKGILIDGNGSLGYGFATSPYKLKNPGGTAQWFEIGNLAFTETGMGAFITLVGGGGYDSADNGNSPVGTSFGGGLAKIFVQDKGGDGTKPSSSWYAESSSPILDVAYIQTTPARHRVFVQVRAYTPSVSVFLDVSDKSYFEGGIHFYFEPVMSVTTEVTGSTSRSIARWSINNGVNGFGFNMTSGQMVITGSSTKPAGQQYIPIKLNGADAYIPAQESSGSTRMHIYSYADLPSVSVNVYGLVMCKDTKMTPSLQPIFSNGKDWFLLSDPSNTTWKPS